MVRAVYACGSHEEWLDAFQEAFARPSCTIDRACPCCKEPALQLRITVASSAADRGRVFFWCDRCLWGLMPNACAIDDHVPLLAGEFEPPEYRIIEP